MSNNRFVDALNKINSFHNIRFSPEISIPFFGMWSTIDFYRVEGVTFTIERQKPRALVETSTLKVAVATLKDPKGLYQGEVREQKLIAAGEDADSKRVIDIKTPDEEILIDYEQRIEIKKRDMFLSMKNLVSSYVFTRFNLSYLAYNSAAQKISLKGEGDLYNLIFENYQANADYFTMPAIKRLIGQMVLAVEDLNGLYHRDIKLENFIVFYYDKKNKVLIIQLGDHNDIKKRVQQCTSFAGTPDHMAPELEACIGRKDFKTYNKLNKHAIDCFALGRALEQILVKVFYFKERTDYEKINSTKIYDSIRHNGTFDARKLVALIASMVEKDPTKRFTIQQVKNHSFFGTDVESRQAFFYELLDEVENYSLKIDGHPLSPNYNTKLDDYYLLLDINTKCVITMGTVIAERITASAHEVQLDEKQIQDRTRCLEFLKNELTNLLDMLKLIIEDRSANEDYVELKKIAIEELKVVEQKTEQLRITKIVYITTSTLAQFPNTLNIIYRLFTKRDEINVFRQFEAELKARVSRGEDYSVLIEEISLFLGDENSLPDGSIKAKYHAELTRTLGQSIYSIRDTMTSEDIPIRAVA